MSYVQFIYLFSGIFKMLLGVVTQQTILWIPDDSVTIACVFFCYISIKAYEWKIGKETGETS